MAFNMDRPCLWQCTLDTTHDGPCNVVTTIHRVPMVGSYLIKIETKDNQVERAHLVQLLQAALVRSDTRALVKLNEIVTDVRST